MSIGPSPSCRSRRSRRRSSSRAVTSRCRESSRSAVSAVGPDRRTGLPGQLVEHLRSRASNTVSPRRGDVTSAPIWRALERQRPPLDPGRRLPRLGQHRPVRPLDPHVRQPQRAGYGGGHGGQDLTRRRGRIQPPPHVAEHLVRVVALAVEQPVHQPLAAPPQRGEADRYRAAGHPEPTRSEASVAPAPAISAYPATSTTVTARVRRRPADDRVDRPEPVAEHRDRQRGHEHRAVEPR